jgi:hypothetical protein
MYERFKVSNSACEFDHVPAYTELEDSGNWLHKGDEIELSPTVNRKTYPPVTTLRVQREVRCLRLMPLYGAGYIPPDGFVRVKDIQIPARNH